MTPTPKWVLEDDDVSDQPQATSLPALLEPLDEDPYADGPPPDAWPSTTQPPGAPTRDESAEAALPQLLPLLTLKELRELPPPRWLIDGHISAGALTLIYGQSGHGKTFVALDQALCVASGEPWHGNTVDRGHVVWVAAEDVTGLWQRVEAWWETHPGVDLDRFRVVPQAVNLLVPDDVAALSATLDTLDPKPALVVVDTLARSIVGGDENSAKDMGLAVAAFDRFRHETGATVLPVHHTGKDGGAERGSSSLRAAADTVIKVSLGSDGVRVDCDKQKNAVPFRGWRFKLDNAGDSCVLTPHPRTTADAIAADKQRVVDALRDLPAPVSQNKLEQLIVGMRGEAARQAMKAAAADPDCPVRMVEGPRGAHLYSLADDSQPELL